MPEGARQGRVEVGDCVELVVRNGYREADSRGRVVAAGRHHAMVEFDAAAPYAKQAETIPVEHLRVVEDGEA
jgi:hypothetical protein